MSTRKHGTECESSLSRRGFLSGCTACAACGLAPRAPSAEPAPATPVTPASPARKVKVRVVFCETTNTKPIWPNIGYNFDARRKQMMDVLTAGCGGLDLMPVRVMDKPKDVAAVIKKDAEVEGYLVCVQGLGWRNDIYKLCTTGKPSLLVDNLFGGSGKFLTQMTRIMGAGKPVDWVSSADDRDIVASANQFTLLARGRSAADVAAAFRATRRKRTPRDADMTCKPDAVGKVDFDKAFQEMKRTKLLVVGGGWGGDAFRKASAKVTGVQFVSIGFKEMAAAYAEADREAAQAFADRWIKQAKEVVEPKRDEIERSGLMYVAMKALMAKHGARGISINCLGGFYGGHIKAYPCLGFSQLNSDGLVGGCEADQMSAMTMAVMTALTGRPGYISDPVMDTSKNHIIYAHCVAHTKPFGPEGASNPYRIRSHSEDRKGAALQSLLPAGYITTTLEIQPALKKILLHQAKSDGNDPSDMACRTKLCGIVKGDIEKLTEGWSMGWHRVTFYGDLKPHAGELAKRWGMQIVEEA